MVVVKPQSLRFNMFAFTNVLYTHVHTTAHTDSMIGFLCFDSNWWKTHLKHVPEGFIVSRKCVCYHLVGEIIVFHKYTVAIIGLG